MQTSKYIAVYAASFTNAKQFIHFNQQHTLLFEICEKGNNSYQIRFKFVNFMSIKKGT